MYIVKILWTASKKAIRLETVNWIEIARMEEKWKK